MGLDTTHDAFHGAYSAFNSFRQHIAYCIGGSFPPHYLRDENGNWAEDEKGWFITDKTLDPSYCYWPDDFENASHYSGFQLFFSHSDCDGEFTPEQCIAVANALESTLEKQEELQLNSYGHNHARGGYIEITRKFIAGCRAAAAANEPLEFQ